MDSVYILRCADGAFYVGLTDDLQQRVDRHQEGRASPFARVRRPVLLAYSETHRNIVEARTREQQIKRWSRAKKEALIRGDTTALKAL